MAASTATSSNNSDEQPSGEEDIVEVASRNGCLPPRFILPPVHRTPACDDPAHLPIVDLSALDDPSTRQETLALIDSACRQWGFFQVLNHGVSLSVLDGLCRVTEEFFALPPALKHSHGVIEEADGQGFGTAFVNPQYGIAEWRDYLIFLTYPESKRNYKKWPPFFRDYIETFSAALLGLSRRLLAIFSENLELPASYIEDAMKELSQKVLISHYPPCPQPDLAMGSCEHSDIGVMTFVWQTSDDVAGLQVKKDGKWHPVEPIRGALVVNVADQVEILSNGVYKSGPHRVVLNSRRSRFSAVTFLNPAGDAEVSPAPSLIDKDHPPLFQPTQFKTYSAKYGIKAE